MSLYESLTRVLAPFAAKINGLLTGWDGTRYSTPGEAVRQQISDLHVLIGDEPGTAIQASAVAYGESNVDAALDTVNGRLQRQQGIIAEAFSAQSTYDVGDSVIYEAGLYTFRANKVAGAWDATKVDGPFKVTDQLSDLKEDFNEVYSYETEYTTSGSGSTISEDVPFKCVQGGYYKIVVEPTNIYATVKLSAIDRIINPQINDTIYNNGYYTPIVFKADHTTNYIRYSSSTNATIKIYAYSLSFSYEKQQSDVALINEHILFDKEIALTDNKIIFTNVSVHATVDTTLISNSNGKCCIVPCNAGDTFIITGTTLGNNPRLWAFTDEDYKLINNSPNNTTLSNATIQALSDGYLICNFYKGASYGLTQKNAVYIDDKTLQLQEEIDAITTDIIPPLTGIDMFGKIACLGDSFTVGGVRNSTDTGWLSARNSYPAVLHNRHTITVTNFGASGSTTKTYYENNIQTVLNAEAHDVYFLCWGLNDAWGSMTIGSASDIHEDYTTNPDTYFGNYGKIIATLRNTFPMARFVLITPWRNVSPFNAYQEPSIEIAETMGIPYIDTRTDAFFASTLWENTLVSSHPTQVTYTGMAYAVERLMEKCIVDNEQYFRYAGIENEVPIDYD